MANGDWAPYSFSDEKGQVQGLDVELVRAIFDEAGCVLVLADAMPGRRNWFLFDNGKIELMSGASRTAERIEHSYFSETYRSETVGVFALAGEYEKYAALTSFAALMATPASLLAPQVGWYGPDYAQHEEALSKSGRLARYEGFRKGLKLLGAGRASLIMGDVGVITYAARQTGVQVRALPFVLLRAPVHLMFSKASTREADVVRINAAIERLHKNGALLRIRQAWQAD